MTVPSKLRVDVISAWAENLPFANKPLVARETYELIERLQQSDLPAKQQLQILEIIKRPATLVLEHMRQRLVLGNAQTDQLLPLGDAFCERITSACESLLLSEGGKKGLFGLRAGVSGQVLALANHFLEQWYLLRVVSHRPVPEGFWASVRDHAARSEKAALAPIARLLALHLAGPASLTPRHLQAVADLLGALPMEKLVSINDSTTAELGQQAFVWPRGDESPQFGWVADDDSLRIDLEKLLTTLRSGSNEAIAPALLADLLQRWDGVRPEKQGRTPTDRPIATSVVIGLRGVVRHLGELEAGSQPTSGFAPATVELSAGGDAFSEVSNPFTRRSEAVQARFLDISDGGCRLRTDWGGVQAGDIIAVHWGRVDWRIGSLTWISRDGDEWECGVQWLLDQPHTAMVSFDSGEPGVALVGQCRSDGEQGLIYGSGTHALHRQCRVKSTGAWQGYSLTTVKSTGLVELARLAPQSEAATGSAAVQDEQESSPTAAPATNDDGAWGVFTSMGAVTATSVGRS